MWTSRVPAKSKWCFTNILVETFDPHQDIKTHPYRHTHTHKANDLNPTQIFQHTNHQATVKIPFRDSAGTALSLSPPLHTHTHTTHMLLFWQTRASKLQQSE